MIVCGPAEIQIRSEAFEDLEIVIHVSEIPTASNFRVDM
jgi:hypothetical protein